MTLPNRAIFLWVFALCLALTLIPPSRLPAEDAAPKKVVGWRTDWTGRYPDATPVTEWSRLPVGPLRDLRFQAARPAEGDDGRAAKLVEKGLVGAWLIIGPFPLGPGGIDEGHIPNEAALCPAEGEEVGELAWKTVAVAEVTMSDPSFVKVDSRWGRAKDKLGCASTNLFASSPGKVDLQLDHAGAVKVWLNGAAVYSGPEPSVSLWSVMEVQKYYERTQAIPHAKRVTVSLVKGWNRLLVKSAGKFNLRVIAAPGTQYEQVNIVWITPMPDWGIATPVIVGDRIFVTAEPDELICVDKRNGQVLWRRSSGYVDVLAEEDPGIKDQVEALTVKLKAVATEEERCAIRLEIRGVLFTAGRLKYDHSISGHHRSVGFCTPTPVSDGRFIYVYTRGVATCFDLEGKRQWIRLITQFRDHFKCSSPVLVGGKLIIMREEGLVALDAATGKPAWSDPDFYVPPNPKYPTNRTPIATSLVPLSIGGTDVVFASGAFVRASDGKILYAPKKNISNPRSTALLVGDTLYWSYGSLWWYRLPKAVEGDALAPETGVAEDYSGGSYASPVYHDGLLYSVGRVGDLAVCDVTGKVPTLVYTRKLDLACYDDFDHVGVGASVALGGKRIFVMDNQGTTIVFEPGREFKQVARNRIVTDADNPNPLTSREVFQASPVFDGKFIYIRGEKNLYCIGSN